MNYPLCLLSQDIPIAPLFGDQHTGAPHVFDFSSGNPAAANIDTAHFDPFQKAVYDELHASGKTWGIGRYLEERRALLRNYPQIVDEGRVFHLGVDVIAPAGTNVFAPISGVVMETGKEEGHGNYGGFIILKHSVAGVEFYSFYGHINTNFLVQVGQEVAQGERFGVLGNGPGDSGGWFEHTHLQIFTPRAYAENRSMQGYIAPEKFYELEEYFPSPLFLLRWIK